jgi:hypothetical protein
MDIQERGVQIRVPATANLMIDSNDRNPDNFPFASDFTIIKNQSILNGFFTRIASTEICMEWNFPNISDTIGNNLFEVDVAGTTYTANLPSGFYNMDDCLTEIITQLNALPVPGCVFSVTQDRAGDGLASITGTANFSVLDGYLAQQLAQGSYAFPTPAALDFACWYADIRPFRYLDFVSENLTYNQDLKDDSTNTAMRSVLLRWYMAYSAEATTYDALGYPVLMGYRRFTITKQFSNPKQIRWDLRQPVGQLSFQVYVNTGGSTTEPFPTGGDFGASWDWLLTLQVSEN